MGTSVNREGQIQSQPVLPVCVQRPIEGTEFVSSRNPLAKREIIDSFMDKLKKCEEEKKEKTFNIEKNGEVKFKKTK